MRITEKSAKLKHFVNKMLPAVVSCLTIVLAVNANSSSCYLINEPKEPGAIEKFKLFK